MHINLAKLQFHMIFMLAIGISPLAAMEVTNQDQKNQLCGIEKLIHNRWVIQEATDKHLGNKICNDVQDKISEFEFDLIYLYKFQIPSLDFLKSIGERTTNKDKKEYCIRPTTIDTILYSTPIIDFTKNAPRPLDLEGDIKFKNMTVKEGKFDKNYIIIINYSNFKLFCNVPYITESNESLLLKNLSFYIKKPAMTQLEIKEGADTYKEALEVYPTQYQEYKIPFIEFHVKEKTIFEKISSFLSQEKEEIDDSRPEDFCLYFLRK